MEFGEHGGYKISTDEWHSVHSWVVDLLFKPDIIADCVAFHRIYNMKRDTKLRTARDEWADVLPLPYLPNLFWCMRMLMIAMPKVTDVKIMEVFGTRYFIAN